MKMTQQTNLFRVIAIILLLLFLLLGFYRSAITTEIGVFCSKIFNSTLFVTSHRNKKLSFASLISWLDTAIYSFLYLFLSLSIVYFWFREKQYIYFSLVVVISLLLLSVILIVLHKITQNPLFYRFSEDSIYFVLSPTPLLLLSVFFYVSKITKSKDKDSEIIKKS